LYIDSNVFIFAATDKDKKGKNCRRIIEMINEKKIVCAASYLVIDEVIWILKKHVGKKDSIKITKVMLSLPIRWIELDKSIVLKMIDILEKTNLDPRDATHLASMIHLGLSSIISEDTDFDKIDKIERIGISKLIEKYQ
jgi:predicted nucleic acid-binding protein